MSWGRTIKDSLSASLDRAKYRQRLRRQFAKRNLPQPQPAATVADATKPAVQPSQSTSAAVSVALLLFLATGFAQGAVKNLAPHTARPVPESLAVAAILGEASNQGGRGMLALARAIRNRATLRGVYGVNNPVISQASPQLRAQAVAAWRKSAQVDITGGATHWGNLRDVQTAAFYRRLQFTCKVGDHYFFKEAKRV